MKKTLLIIVCALTCTAAFAQSESDKQTYADQAAKIQSDIWGSPIAEFKATTVPASLSKESAVILARSFSLSRASSGKLKFGRSIRVTTRTTKFTVFHERVKINDKTALDEFSTLQYQKKLDKTTSQLFAKFVDVNNTFIGAKVIKPAGKEIMVNTSEEVLTKNESKDQKGKLAIPDLQVGDVLDYYICKQDIADKEEGNAYKDNDNIFSLIDDYPVLYYSIDFQFNKKIKVRTIYANGAKQFDESHNDEGDLLLSLKLTNVPKYHGQLWTSGYRQYPYIEIGSAYDDPTDKIIEKNNFDGKTAMLQARKYNFEKNFVERELSFYMVIQKVKDAFKDKKAFRAASPDSIAKVLYAQWQFDTFGHYLPADLKDLPAMKYRAAASRFNAIKACFVLTELKVDHDILLVASRNGSSLDNVFNEDDFDAIIRINQNVPTYLCFDDMVTHYNEIPARFQGEKVIVLHPRRRNDHEYDFTESEDVLPVTTAAQNYINEQLNVSLAGADLKKLTIDRTVSEAGALRHADQKDLLLADEIDAGLMEAAHGESTWLRYKNYVGFQGLTQQVYDAFKKEHDDQVKYYTSEIKAKFDQEPQKVTNCKVINSGVTDARPVFEYTESYEMDNLVKKAGNNYIVDVGKLTGGFLKLDEKDKLRDIDVYMPSARSFTYTITIAIPAGYTAKGIEELAKNKTNKTGSFSVAASTKGNTVVITVTRVYSKNFEKAADWPLLKDLIENASDFDAAKILLEKQG